MQCDMAANVDLGWQMSLYLLILALQSAMTHGPVYCSPRLVPFLQISPHILRPVIFIFSPTESIRLGSALSTLLVSSVLCNAIFQQRSSSCVLQRCSRPLDILLSSHSLSLEIYMCTKGQGKGHSIIGLQIPKGE
jgi:hypothetical protein